jgi:hypothetical protein
LGKCSAERWCLRGPNKWKSLGARSGLYRGCSRTSHCCSCMTTRVAILPTRQMRRCEISSGKFSGACETMGQVPREIMLRNKSIFKISTLICLSSISICNLPIDLAAYKWLLDTILSDQCYVLLCNVGIMCGIVVLVPWRWRFGRTWG